MGLDGNNMNEKSVKHKILVKRRVVYYISGPKLAWGNI